MERIGRYRIVSTIGEGAMGVVYRAEDPIIQRDVAIKVFKIDTKSDRQKELRQRFLAEAKAIGRLDHPAIVTIYDAGFTEGGMPYLVMEFVRGKPLTHYLVHGEAIPIPRLIDMFCELLDALAYAHERGIVHRDIKPANIMVTENGRPKLMDFGIAKVLDETTGQHLTQSGMIIGTPGYMSPEQVSGKPLDHRSDLFSLAVVLWECLTLKKAFEADTIAAVAFKIVYEDLPDPRKFNKECPVALSAVLSRALEKKPERRFDSASAFRDALAMVQHQTWRYTLTQRLRWFPKRHPVGFTLSLFLFLGLLGLGGIYSLRPEWIKSKATKVEPAPPPVKQPEVILTPEQASNPGVSIDEPQMQAGSAPSPLTDEPEKNGGDSTQEKEVSSPGPSKPSRPRVAREPPVKESVKESKRQASEGVTPTVPSRPSTGDRTPSVTQTTEEPAVTRSYGYLTVRVTPVPARVYLDEKYLGTTPLEHVKVPARVRSYRVRIVGPEGITYEERVLILPNKEYTIKHDFKVRGELIIRINQPAKVYIDGRFIGIGSQRVTNLTPGIHRIKVVWENQTHEEDVFVEYPGPTQWTYRFPP